MIVKTQKLFEFVELGDISKPAADLPARQRGRPGESEPDESKLEAFENLQLLPEHLERLHEIRRLRRMFHSSGDYAVSWKPNGEIFRGEWTGNGVKTLSFEAVARICDHMDEMARRRRQATKDVKSTTKTKKAKRAERTSPLFPDADVT